MKSLSKEKMILPGLLLGFACGFIGYSAGSAQDENERWHHHRSGAMAGEAMKISHIPGEPSVEIPAVEIPGFEIPEIRIPAIHIPAIRIEAIHIPAFSVPGGEVAAVHVPAVEVPAVHVPEVVVPTVRVPGTRVAGVNVPERHWRDHSTGHRSSHGWTLPEDGDHGFEGMEHPQKSIPHVEEQEKAAPEQEADGKPRKRERSLYGVKLISL